MRVSVVKSLKLLGVTIRQLDNCRTMLNLKKNCK